MRVCLGYQAWQRQPGARPLASGRQSLAHEDKALGMQNLARCKACRLPTTSGVAS